MTAEPARPQPVRSGERRRRWDSRGLLEWSRTPGGRRASLLASVVVMLGLVGLWWVISSREVTDDATVEAPIHPVAPRIVGVVHAVLADDHQFVEKGEVLIEIDPTAYEVRYAKAAANLAEAVAVAEAAKVGVPITSTTTESELQSARAAADDSEAGVLLG